VVCGDTDSKYSGKVKEGNMIGIAIIGSGAIAEVHIQAFKAFPSRCEVRALADLYPEKAEKLAINHGLSAFVCKDYREAVSRDDIDLVSVCLPPSAHAEAAVAALEARKHVVVEKPMASSLEECDAMIRAA
jgi:UDP-N-acetyl-2-amino-2-deoxyglucuronate dehydrogenase